MPSQAKFFVTNCPCGNDTDYKICCQPFLKGTAQPQTAEQLMRSRYTAYTKAKISYIKNTMQGPALKNFDLKSAKVWVKQATWISLNVLNTKAGSSDDEQGWVEFIATYKDKRGIHELHELSEFHKINGKWYYVSGE